MKKHSLLALFAVGLCAFFYSCSNDDDSQPEANVTTAGGSIKSDDDNLTVTIPAGAVNKDVLIEVVEVSDVVTNGIGKIYRLTHQEFVKPVTLTLKYSEEEVATKETSTALLRLMTRSSETAAWEVVDNFTIDTDAKVLKADVDHFSDWTIVSVEETNVTTAGGSIKSDDDNLTVTIPAGAVDKDVLIEIEEVSDVVTNGIGKIYRLTQQEFIKPVTLTLKYSDEEVTTNGTYPALLRLMTRSSETDAWEVVDNFTIDTDAKVLKADVDHFSDWTLVSTEGTLSFTVDGVTYSNLDLSVTMGTKLGKSALFYAYNDERFFRATADSTIMGTNYATRSLHLGKISALTNSIADTTNVLFVEPTIKSGCYARYDGSSRLSFTKFSTTSGNLVTGSFIVPGVLPTDNTTPCQAQKSISGSFAYKVK